MNNRIPEDVANNLQTDWELQLPETYSVEMLLELLAGRISWLIEKQPEAFFQLMYRLDIPEKKLNPVLHEAGAVDKIARLVYDRQLEKAHSREIFKKNKGDIDKSLEW